jgi:hypothetical protein
MLFFWSVSATAITKAADADAAITKPADAEHIRMPRGARPRTIVYVIYISWTALLRLF